jgi:hypothetical protein
MFYLTSVFHQASASGLLGKALSPSFCLLLSSGAAACTLWATASNSHDCTYFGQMLREQTRIPIKLHWKRIFPDIATYTSQMGGPEQF